jgi:hypothetical protein
MSLTKEKIEELKTKYGKIFKVNLGGVDYVYRPLLRSEYKVIQAQAAVATLPNGMIDPSASSEIEEEMLKICVVYPENIEDVNSLPAGVPSALSAYISEASGFNADSIPEEL